MAEISTVGVQQNTPVLVPQKAEVEKTQPQEPPKEQQAPAPEVAPAIVDKAASDAASSYAIASINAQTPKV